MPTRAAYQPCRVRRCPNYRSHGAYCDAHRDKHVVFEPSKAMAYMPPAATRPNNREFRRQRAAWLSRHPLCVKCDEPAVVLDHIRPHRGDLQLFWSQWNWQSLCVRCHNVKTASETGYRPADAPKSAPSVATIAGSRRHGV